MTNGCIDPDILEELLPDLDALNIDLKGFTDRYYQKLGGDLETVKRFIRRAQSSCHIELTTLIVPGENDTEDEMEHLASWVRSVNPSIPLHVTRFSSLPYVGLPGNLGSDGLYACGYRPKAAGLRIHW